MREQVSELKQQMAVEKGDIMKDVSLPLSGTRNGNSTNIKNGQGANLNENGAQKDTGESYRVNSELPEDNVNGESLIDGFDLSVGRCALTESESDDCFVQH